MDGETFDDLVKRLTATRLTRWDALRGLLASAAVGLTGATLAAAVDARKKSKAARKKAKVGGKGKAKDRKGKAQDKVIICHNGQTLAVAAPAVPAHLAHGDTIGPCSDEGAGTCVPLLQVCVPLVGNPCCDANASCVMSAAGDVAGLPDFACRDNSTTDCTGSGRRVPRAVRKLGRRLSGEHRRLFVPAGPARARGQGKALLRAQGLRHGQ